MGVPRASSKWLKSHTSGRTTFQGADKDVPMDGFWSLSVYNRDGFFEKNELNAYSFNSVTAKRDVDGAARIQFGGCEASTVNCLPITDGWNYTVRLYRPQSAILDGTWKAPVAEPTN
jgi:hypothetical protein